MSKLAPPTERQFPADAFDAVPACLAFFDLEGQLGYANTAMRALWAKQPEGTQIHRLVQQLGSSAAFRVASARCESAEVGVCIARCEFLSEECIYRMQASHVASDLFGWGSSLLVSIESSAASPPLSDEVLANRYRLTTREIRVARLLAEGRSNTQVAAVLSISPHTARTHTERVLQKLDARSRAEVGSILRGHLKIRNSADAQAQNRE